MARPGDRAVGRDRASGGARGGFPARSRSGGLPPESQGAGPGAGSLPPERGQERSVRCAGGGGLPADRSGSSHGLAAQLHGGAGAEVNDRGLPAPDPTADAAAEPTHGDFESVLSAGAGGGRTAPRPGPGLSRGLSDPRGPEPADRAAVAALGPGAAREREPHGG